MSRNRSFRNATVIHMMHYDGNGYPDEDRETITYDRLANEVSNVSYRSGSGNGLLVLILLFMIGIGGYYFISNVVTKASNQIVDVVSSNIQIELTVSTQVYGNTGDAINHSNNKVSYPAGTYYVDQEVNGCYHIYNDSTSGAWIAKSDIQ